MVNKPHLNGAVVARAQTDRLSNLSKAYVSLLVTTFNKLCRLHNDRLRHN